jgi:alkylated DNA repair dioxygenase AlkB
MTSSEILSQLLYVSETGDTRFARFFENVRTELSAETVPRHHSLVVYGRTCHPSRKTQLYADRVPSGYSYSGAVAKPLPLKPWMHELIEVVNSEFEQSFNSILVNLYLSGKDTISAHSDKDVIGMNGVVAISYGGSRTFESYSLRRENRSFSSPHDEDCAVSRDFYTRNHRGWKHFRT